MPSAKNIMTEIVLLMSLGTRTNLLAIKAIYSLYRGLKAIGIINIDFTFGGSGSLWWRSGSFSLLSNWLAFQVMTSYPGMILNKKFGSSVIVHWSAAWNCTLRSRLSCVEDHEKNWFYFLSSWSHSTISYHVVYDMSIVSSLSF